MLEPRSATLRKLHLILERSYVELRNLALGGRTEQIHDLADTFELIPSLMANLNAESMSRIRQLLHDYQAKYAQSSNYVSILDMDQETLESVFRPWGAEALTMTASETRSPEARG